MSISISNFTTNRAGFYANDFSDTYGDRLPWDDDEPGAELDRAYQPGDYDGLGLTPPHVRQLIDRAVSPAVAAVRGYRSLANTAANRAELAAKGFAPHQCRLPALYIPTTAVDGAPGCSIKPDRPRPKKDKDGAIVPGKFVKYENPTGLDVRPDIPASVRAALMDPTITLYLTEGIFKTDAGATAGLCIISIGGVWNWKPEYARADLASIPLNGRRVVLAFDSDWATKENVRLALRQFADWLAERGAHVGVLTLPDVDDLDKTGLDDWLASGGDGRDLPGLTAPFGRPGAIDGDPGDPGADVTRLRAELARLRAVQQGMVAVLTNPALDPKTRITIIMLELEADKRRREDGDLGSYDLPAPYIAPRAGLSDEQVGAVYKVLDGGFVRRRLPGELESTEPPPPIALLTRTTPRAPRMDPVTGKFTQPGKVSRFTILGDDAADALPARFMKWSLAAPVVPRKWGGVRTPDPVEDAICPDHPGVGVVVDETVVKVARCAIDGRELGRMTTPKPRRKARPTGGESPYLQDGGMDESNQPTGAIGDPGAFPYPQDGGVLVGDGEIISRSFSIPPRCRYGNSGHLLPDERVAAGTAEHRAYAAAHGPGSIDGNLEPLDPSSPVILANVIAPPPLESDEPPPPRGYQNDADAVDHFLTECCDIRRFDTITARKLHAAYVDWSAHTGAPAMNAATFERALAERPELTRHDLHIGLTWTGIRLR